MGGATEQCYVYHHHPVSEQVLTTVNFVYYIFIIVYTTVRIQKSGVSKISW